MVSASINFDKSIKSDRLVYNNLWDNVDCWLSYFGGGILVSIGFSPIIFFSNYQNNLWLCIILNLSGIWMLANLILMNSLLRIDGKDTKTNRTDILKAIEFFFVTMDLNSDDDLIIRNVSQVGNFKNGWAITILLHDDKVFINITTLGRGNGPSPFHGLYNYLKCRRIAKYFKFLQL